MATTPNVKFEQPTQLVRTTARVVLDNGIVDLIVAGDANYVQKYLDSAKIAVAIRSVDQYTPPPAKDGVQSEDDKADPEHEGRDLTITIAVVQTTLSQYLLHVDVDPAFIPAGYYHRYQIAGYNYVYAGCTTVSGNPNLKLYERRSASWISRGSGVETSPIDESIERDQRFSGEWRLRVRGTGGAECEYDLIGDFLNDEPELLQ